MPYRKVPLIEKQIYHIFNRGVAQQPMFNYKRDCERFLRTLWFYRFSDPPVSYSKYNNLPQELKSEIENQLSKLNLNVSILAFCLMPNHFHLILRQENEKGISDFLKNISDSYTKYFNKKYDRNGPIFQGQFKAVLVVSDEQLIHLSRYVHLNPVTGYVVKNFEQLLDYLWSSLSQYLTEKDGFCETDTILKLFPSKSKYSEFLLDQVDYQRMLANIRHMTFE